MFLPRFFTCCAICIMIALGGCSEDKPTAPPDNNNNEVPAKDSFSATINGSNLSGYYISVYKFGDRIVVSGTSNTSFLDFTIKSELPPGTYTSDNVENALELGYTKVDGTTLEGWSSLGGGSVSATITKSNSTVLEGTFSGTVVREGSGKSSITNGKFYLNLPK